MARKMTPAAKGKRAQARTPPATRSVSRVASSGRFVSGSPIRTKAASTRHAATLEKLGADPKVIKAAKRG